MKNNGHLNIESIVDLSKYKVDSEFGLTSWPVKPEYVDAVYYGASKASVVYDKNIDGVYVRVTLKNCDVPWGDEMDYELTEDDVAVLRNIANKANPA